MGQRDEGAPGSLLSMGLTPQPCHFPKALPADTVTWGWVSAHELRGVGGTQTCGLWQWRLPLVKVSGGFACVTVMTSRQNWALITFWYFLHIPRYLSLFIIFHRLLPFAPPPISVISPGFSSQPCVAEDAFSCERQIA